MSFFSPKAHRMTADRPAVRLVTTIVNHHCTFSALSNQSQHVQNFYNTLGAAVPQKKKKKVDGLDFTEQFKTKTTTSVELKTKCNWYTIEHIFPTNTKTLFTPFFCHPWFLQRKLLINSLCHVMQWTKSNNRCGMVVESTPDLQNTVTILLFTHINKIIHAVLSTVSWEYINPPPPSTPPPAPNCEVWKPVLAVKLGKNKTERESAK